MLDKIKKAFEKKLATMTPAISTAYESVSFTPVSGVPYQRVQIAPGTPENTVLASGFYREKGEFQIFLMYPTNQGTGAALARAQLVRNTFKRGTNLVEGDLTILIFRTPTIAGTQVLGDRLVVPIIIQYTCDVQGEI